MVSDPQICGSRFRRHTKHAAPRAKKGKNPPPCLLIMFSSVGGSFLWWGQGGGRNGLGDKINIPFVLLAAPAVRKIMLIFF